MDLEIEEQLVKSRPRSCECLQNNVLLESLVVTLTIISSLAISGQLLLAFDFITVPSSRTITPNDTSEEWVKENEDVMNILELVFRYTSMAIAGIFVIEIFSKVCSLRKEFFFKAQQMFDAVIVLLTVAAEVTFYVLEPPALGFIALKYIVVVRLWRIPELCDMRAITIKQKLHEELEVVYSSSIKTEEKCARLEEALAAQKIALKRLRDAEMKLSTDTTLLEQGRRNGELHGAGNYNISHPKGDGLTKLESSRKQKAPVPVPTGKAQPSAEDNNRQSKLSVESQSKTSKKQASRPTSLAPEERLTEETSFTTEISKDGDGDGPPRRSSDTDRRFSPPTPENVNPPENSTETNAQRLSQPRQRKRRSSTSEFIDYSTLTSPTKDEMFSDDTYLDKVTKTNSCPALDIADGDIDSLVSKTKTKAKRSRSQTPDYVDDVDGKDNEEINKKSSVPSESSNEHSSEIDQRPRKDRKPCRRFVSCPEFVFTQRMSLTNDESILLGESHAVGDSASAFDNLGFDYDKEFRLQVLAEFDGSKTYRSEDGIPMTSL